jgi:hypothetical protein
VGVVLFQNVHKLNWKNVSDSMPAYFALFFIPFTYSILQGVAIANVVYIILGIFTGDIFYAALDLYIFYFGAPPFGKWKAESFHLLSRVVSADAHATRRSCSQPEGRATGTPPHYPPTASEVRSVDGVTAPQSARQQSISGGGAGGGGAGGGGLQPSRWTARWPSTCSSGGTMRRGVPRRAVAGAGGFLGCSGASPSCRTSRASSTTPSTGAEGSRRSSHSQLVDS